MVTIRGEGEGSMNVFHGEFREIHQDLCDTHARGEPAEHVINGDSHAPDTGLPAPFTGFDRDAVAVIFRDAK